MMEPVYLDNNATTQVVEPAREAMLRLMGEDYANPSSPYTGAQRALAAVDRARRQVASLVGAAPREILFTSGGTESNNSVLRTATAQKASPRLVISAVEHHSTR